ncbi:hypothetical protein [Aurantiacibacter flavus]|uniref:Ig-like domain-containing protein n=1 Tax=Aurantiacibacter flavus TaxID=3145232 RepID=A0ABV0CYT8_9SPHN
MRNALALDLTTIRPLVGAGPTTPPPPIGWAPEAAGCRMWDARKLPPGPVASWPDGGALSTLSQGTAPNRPINVAGGVTFDGANHLLSDTARALVSEASYDLGPGVTCTGLSRAPDKTWWVAAHSLGQSFTDAKLIHYSADFSSVLASLDLGVIYGAGSVGGVQGLVYDTGDDTLWFVSATADAIFNITTAGVDVPANRIAFPNGNGLAINQADGELIACQAPGGTNLIRRIDKATGATIASSTLAATDSDHLFYHEASKTLCQTSGTNGGTGKLTFYAMGQPNFVDQIGSVNIPELDAIEGVYLADGKAWFCNDALSRGVGPANTVEQFDTGEMLGTTAEFFGIASWTAPTSADCLISIGEPVLGGHGAGLYPLGENALRFHARSYSRTWTGLPSWSTPKILFVRFDAISDTCRLWIDGVEYSSFTENAPISSTTRPLCDRNRLNIGATYEDAIEARHLASTIKALGYSMVTQDRQKIEGWLAHEFDLTANLSSGHPYKSTAPTNAVIAPANTYVPAITGTFTQGQTLSVDTGIWTGSEPRTYSCQWTRDGASIPGATGTTYTLTGADVGTVVDCTVTATNSAGSVSISAGGEGLVAAFSGASFSDTFTGASDTPLEDHTPDLGGAWVRTSGAAAGFMLDGANRVYSAEGGTHVYRTSTTIAEDQYAQVDLTLTADSTSSFGPMVRCDASGNNLYFGRYNAYNNIFQIGRTFGGSTGILASGGSSMAVGETKRIRLEVATSGANVYLSLMVDGALVASFTDTGGSRITGSGSPGLRAYYSGAGIVLGNFAAGPD